MKLTLLLSIIIFFVLILLTRTKERKVIVSSHFREDLTWLKRATWDVAVIDHEGSETPAIEPSIVIPNRGNESSSYIRYIIDHWDNLPDYMAFIHGHEYNKHQKYKHHMLELIERAHLTGDCYIPLNGYWLSEPSPYNVKSSYYLQIAKYWYLFEPYIKRYPNQSLLTDACGQFIVSKNKIKKYPFEAWKTWYDALVHPDTHGELGFVFEYTWHYLFDQPWRMKPKPIRLRPRFIKDFM
jgi:hypothetical protein